MNDAFRTIPKVDVILKEPALYGLPYGQDMVKRMVQKTLDRVREAIAAGRIGKSPDAARLAAEVAGEVSAVMDAGVRAVINAAGVVVHTNLGRAPLAEEAVAAMVLAAEGYSDLEYDLAAGVRGSRQNHIRPVTRLCFGAEDALVVNNNAAAVLLVLNTLARDREVIVSRGELVEIGGSFRVPEVMAMSGAVMREVGATNKTKLDDYRSAVTDRTALILKVHRSNFSMVGFTEETEIRDLSALAREFGIPFYVDMGSGVPFDLTAAGIPDEWTIPSCLGFADVVSFSGDKALGGPQAGIILGRAVHVEKMAKNPLHRAVRVDKLCIAALSTTLRLLSRGRYGDIPVLRMILEAPADVRARAVKLRRLLRGCRAGVVETSAVIGGGSAPTKSFPSYGVLMTVPHAAAVHERLRKGEPAVVARIDEDSLTFDMKAVEARQIPVLAARITDALDTGREG